MSGAFGVDSNETVKRIWKIVPGAEGATVEGHVVRLPVEGVVPSPRHIGARISGGRPLRIHRASSAVQANNAFNTVDDQFRTWLNDLLLFGGDTYVSGSHYLGSGYQAVKIAFADTTTYSDADIIAICGYAVQGADGITSAAEFAASAYAARNAAAPTRALLWADENGRKALNAMVDYGPLVDEPPFTRPAAMRA